MSSSRRRGRRRHYVVGDADDSGAHPVLLGSGALAGGGGGACESGIHGVAASRRGSERSNTATCDLLRPLFFRQIGPLFFPKQLGPLLGAADGLGCIPNTSRECILYIFSSCLARARGKIHELTHPTHHALLKDVINWLTNSSHVTTSTGQQNKWISVAMHYPNQGRPTRHY